MEKVVVLPELAYKLNELILVLYKEDYFGFLDSAKAYVITIFDFIYTIPNNVEKKRRTPMWVLGIANTNTIVALPGTLLLM